jgi:xanthine dehydrogenase accessory factor
MKELLQILAALNAVPSDGAVLATLVKVEGSSYRRPGARMLLTAGGRRAGSISGGCLEDDVLGHAREVLASGAPKTITYDTTIENDLVWGVGLGCHGVVHVLIEKLPPQPVWAAALRENLRCHAPTELTAVWRATEGTPPGTYLARDLPPLPTAAVFHQTIMPPVPLIVFGAGDDTQPLVRMAKEIGWHVTVVDPRPALATSARFPDADSVVIARPEVAPARLALGSDTVALVMTHHYAHDVPLLRALLTRPLAYLGLLGPRKRAEKILADLVADGLPLTPEMRSRLHAPVGLDLGADVPEEVALAILAEIQSVLSGRDARPLRDRRSPIHG